MTNIRAIELSPEVRNWIQSMLHRELEADEELSFIVHAPVSSATASDNEWLDSLDAMAREIDVPTLPHDFSRADIYADGRG